MAASTDTIDSAKDGTESVHTRDTGGSVSTAESLRSVESQESLESTDSDIEPPLLRYSRITPRFPTSCFQRDSISSVQIVDTGFILGTHNGILYFLDTDYNILNTLKCHRSTVMNIFTNDTNFATASLDGTIVIGNLSNPTENLIAYDFKRPLNSVVLDNDYQNNKTFVSGGMAGEIILSQRNWLGNRLDMVLSKDNGMIQGIFKLDSIIFWMNNNGITFIDIVSKKELLNVNFRDPLMLQNIQLLKPHVHYPETDRIIVGWGDQIWLFKISLNKTNSSNSSGNHLGSIISSAATSLRAAPDVQIELEHTFTIPMVLAGITSFKDDQLLCLGYDIPEVDDSFDNESMDANITNLKLKSIAPELRIYDMITEDEISNDEVVVKNYQDLSLNDYHLIKYIYTNSIPKYYLLSATDCILIQEFSLNDHYQWYLKHNNFLKAWDIARYVTYITFEKRMDIGLEYINNEMKQNNWNLMGSLMAKIFQPLKMDCVDDPDLTTIVLQNWQTMLLKCINGNHINNNLVENIPNDMVFDTSLYDSILEFFLKEDKLVDFEKNLQKWNNNLYNSKVIESILEEKINETSINNTSFLKRQLIYIYLQDEKFLKAVEVMTENNDPRTIDLLLKHEELITQLKPKIIEIILLPIEKDQLKIATLSQDKMVKLFAKSLDLIFRCTKFFPLDEIIGLFDTSDDNLNKLLLYALEYIGQKDKKLLTPHQDQLIKLYSEYDPSKLLTFLKENNNYHVDKAIDICKSKTGLYNELIYLWGRIGESKKALTIIIDEFNDPKMAIEYVKSWGDMDLWDFIISYTIEKPNFIKLLLENYQLLGERYNIVIENINDELSIIEFEDTITNTCKEVALCLNVKKTIFDILDDETRLFAKEYLSIRDKGKVFEIDTKETKTINI